MAYSNPGWTNDSAPYLNQTNLNNISNTLQKVPIENGGTNATTASAALSNLGGLPKSNVTSKGSANTPVFFNSSGVASPISSPLPVSLGGTGQTSADSVRSALRLVRYPQSTTTVGSSTNPVYINDGLAASCDYTLNGNVYTTVPSNAVFTDTTNLSSMTGTLPVSKGGTGQTTLTGVRGWLRSVRYPDSTDTVGSATKPVYINGGLAASCTYSLAKSVPADAVFTDTTNLSSMTGTLPVSKGGTGQTSADDVRSAFRLVRYPQSTTTVGSATNPVYINDGLTASCTYSLNKTVPADAKFTDTTNLSSMTGVLPIGKGGTGATGLTHAQYSASGITVDLLTWGKIVVLWIGTSKYGGSGVMQATNIIPSAYRPSYAYVVASVGLTDSSGASGVARVVVNTTGTITVTPTTSEQVVYRATVCYLLAD